MRYVQRRRRSRPRCRLDMTGPSRHPVEVAGRDPKRLATALIDRRGQLGMTQEEFVQAAGMDNRGRPVISVKQLQRIEALSVVNPRSKTLAGLDRAARWHPGSARRTLEGNDPIPLEQLRDLLEPELRDDTERELWGLKRIPVKERVRLIEEHRRFTESETG